MSIWICSLLYISQNIPKGDSFRFLHQLLKKIVADSSLMATCLHEEVKRLQNLVYRLTTEIDVKNQRMECMEKMLTLLSTSLGDAIDARDLEYQQAWSGVQSP
ncbi:uncharacterized protein LOC113353845 [Papaver somniferum]|uniref:uncharacterized protein LOC113353845 n=1 Tax=Papaver somniferum TaxID=3469 RepID=UPI000E6F95C2|nr:uncharacterized protein LOC113353845 [Papaver somniferum]